MHSQDGAFLVLVLAPEREKLFDGRAGGCRLGERSGMSAEGAFRARRMS